MESILLEKQKLEGIWGKETLVLIQEVLQGFVEKEAFELDFIFIDSISRGRDVFWVEEMHVQKQEKQEETEHPWSALLGYMERNWYLASQWA